MTADRDALRGQVEPALMQRMHELGVRIADLREGEDGDHCNLVTAVALDTLLPLIEQVRRDALLEAADALPEDAVIPVTTRNIKRWLRARAAGVTEPSAEDMDAPVGRMPKSVRRYTMRPNAEDQAYVRYQPCVTNAEGRCTRFSHNHAGDQAASEDGER